MKRNWKLKLGSFFLFFDICVNYRNYQISIINQQLSTYQIILIMNYYGIILIIDNYRIIFIINDNKKILLLVNYYAHLIFF